MRRQEKRYSDLFWAVAFVIMLIGGAAQTVGLVLMTQAEIQLFALGINAVGIVFWGFGLAVYRFSVDETNLVIDYKKRRHITAYATALGVPTFGFLGMFLRMLPINELSSNIMFGLQATMLFLTVVAALSEFVRDMS